MRLNNIFIKNVKFDGLRDDRSTWDRYGMKFVYCNNIRLEGVKIVNFGGNGCTFEGTDGKRVSGFTLMNSYIANNWPLGAGHCQGFYTQYADNGIIEGTTFHQNGGAPGVETDKNHGTYMQGMGGGSWLVTGNLFSENSSHGLQQRSGGINRWNLFVNNAIHMSYGLVNVDSVHPGGVTGIIERNLYYGNKTINGSKRGWSLELSQISPNSPGVVARDLLFIKDTQGNASPVNVQACKQPIKNADKVIPPGKFNLKLENIFVDGSWKKTPVSIQDGSRVIKGNNVGKIVTGDFTLPKDYVEQCKNDPAKIKQFILAGFSGYGISLPTI